MEVALRAEIAEDESEKLASRVSLGHRSAAVRGGVMGSVPYGYEIVEGDNGHRRAIVLHEAKNVLRAHEDFDAGLSPVKIAKAFNAEGIKAPRGGIWKPNTILGDKKSSSGLLRNPIYIGQVSFGKTKTKYNPKTDKTTITKSAVEDVIVTDAPWLRIVPDDLWQRNQDRLNDRSFLLPSAARRPDYLLTGLVKCGECGSSYSIVSNAYGCIGRRVGNCTNRRRVSRPDLERVVLEGLRDRIAQSHIIDLFMPEYLQELEKAKCTGQDRRVRAELRLEEINAEIANYKKQIGAGAAGFAAKLLNEELERLGAEKHRLEKDLRGVQPQGPVPTSTEHVLDRLKELLSDLGTALQGDERDAIRAARSSGVFSARSRSRPRRPRGKPTGAALGRCGLPSKAPSPPCWIRRFSSFEYYVDIDRQSSDTQEGVYADMAAIGRLLDDAEFPVTFEFMVQAMNPSGKALTHAECSTDERRARLALAQFKRDGLVRTIGLGTAWGTVWDDRGISDAEWLTRYRGRADITPPIGILRWEPMSAHVVVIGSGESPAGKSS